MYLQTAKSTQVLGNVYAANFAPPTPGDLTTAVMNMQAAYTAAMAEVPPDFTNFGGGALGGATLIPGIYKFGTTVNIDSDLTLTGACNDVYVFQISLVACYFTLGRFFHSLLHVFS